MRSPALERGRIGALELKNRFVKSATYEGMSPSGRVSEALIAHHAMMAEMQVGLTTVAYAAVSPEGRTFGDQLLIDEGQVVALRRLTDAVHARGAKVSIQLAHCGAFSKIRAPDGRPPAGPSAGWNTYGLLLGVPRVRRMSEAEVEAIPETFARAATLACEAGFDALEIHCGHGYLLSQFLSPLTNRRRDRWGGELEGRAKLALAVIRAVRAAVGDQIAILAKLNTRDGVEGGLEMEETLRLAPWLVDAGADCLVPSGGLVARSPFYLMRGRVPLSEMVAAEKSSAQRLAIRLFGPMVMKSYPYRSCFFLEDALQIARAVDVPVALLGGVDSAEAVRLAMQEGFGFVAMGRALLADPDFIVRLSAGEEVVSRCTHCNACVGEMDRGGVRCVLDDQPA